MSITINGSGTITGISTGGIPDGVVDTDVLADNAVTFGKIGTTEQGQLCKAWVNFDGTGTVAIRAAYNVSSITDNGTGDYTVNFANNLSDANYSVSGSLSGSSFGARTIQGLGTSNTDKSSGAYRFQTGYANPPGSNFVIEDNSSVCLAFFR
jgi:hypothetical protein